MIDYIKGTLVKKSPTGVVIDCNGVGYYINISVFTYSQLGQADPCKVFTHLSIKEDAHTLYGFADEEERRLFRNLISVSGVGASTARMMLSSLSPSDIQHAIINGNVSVLQSIKGIGAKSAQRIIIDLKDKLLKSDNLSQVPLSLNNTIKEEALSALLTLGFAKSGVEKVLEQVIKNNGINLPVEQMVKMALKSL
jgi:holliday junction DNA helicase RuvA